MTNVQSLGRSGALIIHCSDRGGKLDLPSGEIQELFKAAGVLLFRGFGVDAWTMKAFADRFTARYNRDRLRPTVAGSEGLIQKVVEGTGYTHAHSEQANSPFRPDAIWFGCVRPAARGGETLYWDGVRLWNELPLDLKEVFSVKKIRFFQRYSVERWKLFLGPGATLVDARRSLGGIEGVSYHIAEDDSIYLEYVCSAVVKTRFGGRDAFANSMLSERANTLGDLMSFEDGQPITENLVEGVTNAMAPLTEHIAWEAGDLALIDNSRFMHGRNSFTDTRREIFSCLSFLNF